MQKKALKVSQRKHILRAVLVVCLSMFVFATIALFSQSASAAELDANYIEMVREKKFKGAADESELKVLTVLPAKKNKVEVSEESTEGF